MDAVTDTARPNSVRQEMRISDRCDDNGSPVEIESEELARGGMFEDVDIRSILGQVPSKLQGEAERSLWRRINSELTSGGPRGVTSYLRSQFDEISKRLRAELAATADTE